MTEPDIATIPVWDRVIRIFHWSLVAAVTIAWFTAEEWDSVHEISGYVILALVGFRLIWGLTGSRYARFRQFVRSPQATLVYLRAMLAGREQRYLGHNPAGGAMVVALILTLAVVGGTGWMMTLDAFWGHSWIEDIHELFANLLLVLIVLHVAGVLFASIRHDENLVRAMVTGLKRPPEDRDVG